MVNGFQYYRALESVSIASALSTALTIYPCQIRVHQRWQSKLQLLTARKEWWPATAAVHLMQLPVNIVIHTTLVGLEPATFRSLVDCWSDVLPVVSLSKAFFCVQGGHEKQYCHERWTHCCNAKTACEQPTFFLKPNCSSLENIYDSYLCNIQYSNSFDMIGHSVVPYCLRRWYHPCCL